MGSGPSSSSSSSAELGAAAARAARDARWQARASRSQAVEKTDHGGSETRRIFKLGEGGIQVHKVYEEHRCVCIENALKLEEVRIVRGS